MRRKDKEINDPGFYDLVFSKAEVICAAFRDEPYPYCLPFNFVRKGDAIYLHCAREGRKLDLIRANPNVGFCLYCDLKIVREKSTTYFNSIVGEGEAAIVEDPAEKGEALDALGEKYAAVCARPATEAMIERTAIIKIKIVALSGKRSAPRDD